MSYLEVRWVHPQLEGVQLAQFQQAAAQVVNLGHGLSDSTHDLLSVTHHGGRTGSQVRPVGEVSLGLRIHEEHPVEAKINIVGHKLQWRNRSARGTYKTVACRVMPRL